MHRIKEIVNNRPICILSFGKSIEELERRIEEYRGKDICWVGFSNYTLLEDNILAKIGESFDIIHDAVPVTRDSKYNINKRIPDFTKLLDRGSLLISSRGLIRNEFKLHGNLSFYGKYNKKIIFREDYFTKPIVFGGDTFTWTIYLLTLSNPKRIITFGADGYIGEVKNFATSYYKPELWETINTSADIRPITELNNATKYINTHFNKDYKQFREYVNMNKKPEIINCSPNSYYNVFKTISYDEVKNYV